MGGLDFIVFYFEFDRYGSGVMDWATSVLATNQNRRVIVATHYAGSDSTPSNLSPAGDAILAALGSNPNFFLMMGGHVFNGSGEGEGSRSDTVSGHTVRTLISDYQGRFNGGDGLMRLMTFSPSNNIVRIKTYSPWTGQFETDANSEFTFTYNLQLPSGAGSPATAYVALGTNMNVAPGSQNSFVWSGLQASKTYEWYVKVTDQFGNSVTSATRQFSTGVNLAPVASNQTVTVIGDQPTQLTLLASDGNGDALTFKTNSLPIRGLNTNFDPINGTITYTPARGYRGLDRFTYQANDTAANSAVANFDLIVTAPPDANTNGLPDSWEAKYGVTDPNGDDDGDGMKNLAEYLANTNPTNSASKFKILDAKWQPDGFFNLSWTSVGGTRYRVQYSNGATNGGITFTDLIRFIDTEMDTNAYGMAATQSFTDTFTQTGVPTNGVRYYRIKVNP